MYTVEIIDTKWAHFRKKSFRCSQTGLSEIWEVLTGQSNIHNLAA